MILSFALIYSDILLFADETSLPEPVKKISITKLNNDLAKLSALTKQWLINFNPNQNQIHGICKEITQKTMTHSVWMVKS